MKSRRLLNLSALLLSSVFALSPLAVDAARGASSLMSGNAILGKGNGQMLVKSDRITYDTTTGLVTAPTNTPDTTVTTTEATYPEE